MRNTSKMTTLENKFPLLAVEHGCIISKDADITVAFEVELPELYTVTGAEYEAIHGCWCKAIKVLPDYSVVHKQDWFIKERYKPELQKDDMSFLSRSFERHFNERQPRFLAVREPRGRAVDRRTGLEGALYLRQQRAPGVGQRRRARGAIEQLHAEIDLEVRNRLRHGRLALAELACGSRERAEQRGFGERDQGFGGVVHAALLTLLYR